MREVDTHFTSKLFGYRTCEEYYTEACLDAKVQDIQTPTIFLNAADDMFSPCSGKLRKLNFKHDLSYLFNLLKHFQLTNYQQIQM